MARAMYNTIEEAVVGFCRFARSNGLSGGITETLSALEAARTVGIQNRQIFKMALRAVLCSSQAEWNKFEDLFESFWTHEALQSRPAERKQKSRASMPESPQQEGIPAMLPAGSSTEVSADRSGKAVLGATLHERLKQADFSHAGIAELAELERIALRLLRQMSLRLSRRLKIAQLGNRLDLRRTIRLNIGRGGEPIDLSFRRKKLQQYKLAILLDISGSMNPYSLFLARFAYVLARHFKRVDTFVFSTRLTDITGALRARRLEDALQALSQEAPGWSGGTRIGASLQEFNKRYGRLLSRNTLFIMLSDGWDTGEPQLLAAELGAIKRRVRKVFWLNPLLGLEGYQPVTRGMSAALPYIDVFAPAHNLQSLLELERHLGSAR